MKPENHTRPRASIGRAELDAALLPPTGVFFGVDG